MYLLETMDTSSCTYAKATGNKNFCILKVISKWKVIYCVFIDWLRILQRLFQMKNE